MSETTTPTDRTENDHGDESPPVRVDHIFVAAVEDAVGYSTAAWDLADARELCAAVLRRAGCRAEVVE